ncbi:LamG domain-containing protein [Sphingobacterium sp. SGG-5]|uniref:LamG domain-containing protein n=1 Tax=Sphingobacterium sp. SGG-5 TaxID=2710881 RepID=UPI0013EB4E8A|nr:LamG domain-containing protein [Sphingobacterium sp. SGG-5]NGM62516.1 LamG domain-containing protein [Sphingobacterium sp. SGG-5]
MKNLLNKIFLGIGLLSVLSCTVFDDPAPIFEEEVSSLEINKRRVLLINVDGAVGEIVQEVMPPRIAALLANSKYTFGGLSDANTNYASTWASIAKGVPVSKHQITSDDFAVHTGDDESHESIPYFPSFMYRLEEIKPHYKTSIVMRDENMAKELFNEVENRHFFATDAEVADYTENYLKTSKDMLTIVQLSSVMEAGRATGFSGTNGDYTAAIQTVDGYIGQLVDAVKARETYADEEWLIIVQSNNGGSGLETGGGDFESKNIFVILNHPRFQPYEYVPHYLSGARFYKTSRSRTDYDANGVEATNSTSYNMTGDEMTVEFFLKANEIYESVSNTFVFGKAGITNQNNKTDEGWFILQRSKGTGVYVVMSDKTSLTTLDGFATPYTKGKWDHMAMTIKKTGTTVNRSMYSNGVLISSTDFTVAANATLNNTAPFRIQHGLEHNSFHNQDTELSEIRIFNKALTRADIERHACLLELPESDPSYADLTGYYPLKEDFNNRIATGPNLVQMGTAPLEHLPATGVATFCDTDPRKVTVLTNIDAAPLIFYWLRQRYETYGWSTADLLKPFELEFLGGDNN